MHPMFIAALFTMVKMWKQPKCPSTDEWIKKMLYIHNGILCNHNKGWNSAICDNMAAPEDYYVQWSKVLERHTVWFHVSVKST